MMHPSSKEVPARRGTVKVATRQEVTASSSQAAARRKSSSGGWSGKASALLERHPKLKAYLEKVRKDNLRFLVSAVAWNLLVSVVPVAIGMIGIVNLLFRSPSQQHVIVRQLSRALQGVLGPSYLEQLVHLTIQHSALTATAGVLSALWAADSVGFALSQSFQAMFEVRPRGFLEEKLIHVGMFVVFVLLLLLIAAGTAALYHVWLPGPLEVVLRTAFTLLASFVLFAVTYIVYPNTEKRFTLENVWRGALLAAILFQLLTFIWPLYVAQFSHYGGILVPLMVLILWIYFFAQILLAGAEVVAIATIEDAEQRGQPPGPSPEGSVPQHDSLRHQASAS
jgi:YihY family inner membrane protein